MKLFVCIERKCDVWSFCKHSMELYTLWTGLWCDGTNVYDRITKARLSQLCPNTPSSSGRCSQSSIVGTWVFLHTVASVYCRYEVDLYIFLWRTVTVAVLVWPRAETLLSAGGLLLSSEELERYFNFFCFCFIAFVSFCFCPFLWCSGFLWDV